MTKQVILLKLTGELLSIGANRRMNVVHVHAIASQIKELSESYHFGIVMGGGNIFRGAEQYENMALNVGVAHQVGMMATVMNGMIVDEVFKKAGLETELLSAFPSSITGKPISQSSIEDTLKRQAIPIFTGGIGTPYFTTDTTAIIRALQMNASEVWKGTTVNGIYTEDPKKNPQAQFIKILSFQDALDQKLTFMDASALQLAQQHGIGVRVFNIFEHNALKQSAHSKNFGSYLR